MTAKIHQPDTAQPQIVLAIFDGQPQAEAAVQAMSDRGFTREQLSVLFRPDDTLVTPSEMVAIDREAEETGTDVAVGGTVGGLAGFLGGLALSAIPGVGPILAAGVLATTIGGAMIGSAIGERWASFSRLGVPGERVSRYGQAIEAGQVIVAVMAHDAGEVMRAREALALHQANEIDVYPQQSLEQPLPPASDR